VSTIPSRVSAQDGGGGSTDPRQLRADLVRVAVVGANAGRFEGAPRAGTSIGRRVALRPATDDGKIHAGLGSLGTALCRG